MKVQYFVFCICHVVTWILVKANGSLRYNIGAVMDEDGTEVQTALKFTKESVNNKSGNFKIDTSLEFVDSKGSLIMSDALCTVMARGVFAFFGKTDPVSYSAIATFSQHFHMPFITYSVPLNVTFNPLQYVLWMRPSYNKAVIDVISYYKWQHVYYVYDSQEGLQRLNNLYDSIHVKEVKVQVESVMLDRVENAHGSLIHVRDSTHQNKKHIVLDISNESELQALLGKIILLGMNTRQYHYLIGGLVMDELDLTDFQYSGANLTGFRVVSPSNGKVQDKQKEWSGLNPREFPGAGSDKKISLEAALTMDAFLVIVDGLNATQPFKNVMKRGRVTSNGAIMQCNKSTLPWVYGLNISEAMKKVNFNGVTGYIQFNKHGFRINYTLDVLLLESPAETPKVVGHWRERTGLEMNEEPNSPTSSLNSENNTIIITTILNAPYAMYKEKQEEDGTPLVGNERYEGYCVDLAQKIADHVGFSYILKEVDDGNFGTVVKGAWNGMVGELIDGKAHMAVAPLTINSARERVVDFSKPFMSLGISIMIKKPEKSKPGVFSFMDPLSKQIWIYIILAYIGVSIVLFLVSRFSPYEWQIEDSINGPSFTNDFTLLNSLWFALGAFMQQGCDISPRSLSGRIVGSVWWFFTLILISSYTANLAAFLTVERMISPIESADDLAKQTEIQYGTLSSGSTQDFFKTSSVDVYKRMWDFMKDAEPSVFENKTEYGVDRVRNSKGKYAFLLESTMNEYHNQRKPCNTMKVGQNLDSKGYGIATPLGSELRNKVNLAVLKLREDGELQKMYKKWWYDKGECNSEADGGGSSQDALTLSNVAGIFYILIGGLGLSMLVSLVEFLYKSKVESKRQKKALANSFRNKARMAAKGPDHENGGYTYTAPQQIINYDQADYYDSTHTQV